MSEPRISFGKVEAKQALNDTDEKEERGCVSVLSVLRFQNNFVVLL